jgi:hypothetical protein
MSSPFNAFFNGGGRFRNVNNGNSFWNALNIRKKEAACQEEITR